MESQKTLGGLQIISWKVLMLTANTLIYSEMNAVNVVQQKSEVSGLGRKCAGAV